MSVSSNKTSSSANEPEDVACIVITWKHRKMNESRFLIEENGSVARVCSPKQFRNVLDNRQIDSEVNLLIRNK